MTRARSAWRAGDQILLPLADDLLLTLDKSGSITLEQRRAPDPPAALDDASGAPQALRLPDAFTLEANRVSLWQLKRLNQPVLQAVAYTVLRDALGVVRHVALEADWTCAHVFGTGERFNAVDQMGRETTGRVVEKFTRQGDQTYLPVPMFLTDKRFGLFCQSDIPVRMSFGERLTIAQETEGVALSRHHVLTGAPADMLQRYMALTGQPALPPEWAFGVWISGNGWNCDDEVDAQLRALKRYDYPASVMVLEQWSDEMTFYRWHPTRWRSPEAVVRRVREAGLRLLLWQIPILKHTWDAAPSDALLADIEEAVAKGYVVLSADGSPYRVTENWFHHSLLPDFTNPEAVKWWFAKREYLLAMGVEGFKTDGGEFLFEKTARLHNGMSGRAAHNRYPMQYVGAYRDFLRAHGVDGVTFSRAGTAGAQTLPIHWAGDQKSAWEELPSQLYAGISAGLSGVVFWGFDIGGFAGDLPDAELYRRATALGCFSPIMQWHSEPRGGQYGGEAGGNNDRSPWNLAERLHDDALLADCVRYARLREQLRPYLWQEAQACVALRRPMMAHLCIDFPDDPRVWDVSDEYLLGRELLCAPVTRRGADCRKVYLPRGAWRDFFTGRAYAGDREWTVACPPDAIAVFRREARA